MNSHLPPVHVEVCLKPQSTAKSKLIKEAVLELIINRRPIIQDGIIPIVVSESQRLSEKEEFLVKHVKQIKIADMEQHPMYNGPLLYNQDAQFSIHVFKSTDEEPIEETTDDNGTENEEISACKQWTLPNDSFDGLWESLIFDNHVKYNLLEYASTTMRFSDLGVDQNLISWNRVVLLYGPPGTGKTSLCKGLAQKLAIRMSHRYPSGGLLIEINAHSLFSKWFSESGKLVMKLFKKIFEIVEDEESFVCVLIDEVESLTAARKSALSGSEPSDSIRVVNALLTQLDHLKRYKNVLILTTSNITEAIDLAFVDRADIKQYIGPPSVQGRYSILRSCLMELMRVSVISPSIPIPKWNDKDAPENTYALKLKQLSECCEEGMSGRSLRKLPFLSHAFYLNHISNAVTLEQYLLAIETALKNKVLQLSGQDSR